MSVHETPCPSLTEHAARALSEDDERAGPLWAFVLRVEREWEAEQRLTACGTVACQPGRHRPDCGWARIDIGEDYRPAYASPLPQAELDESESELRAAFGDR